MGSSSSSADNDIFKKMHDALNKHNEAANTANSKPPIRRVPFTLREQTKKKYFEPRVVSIGPIHYDKFKYAEEIKLRLAQQFVKYVKKHDQTQTHESLYGVIEAEIKELRKCYAEEDTNDKNFPNDKKLAKILFVDGCAVLQFIRFAADEEKFDDLKIKMDMATFAKQDLLLLENQLPYRVLDLLMIKNGKVREELQTAIKKFIENSMFTTKQALIDEKLMQNPTHLLDLLRKALLPKQKQNIDQPDPNKQSAVCKQPKDSSAVNIDQHDPNKQSAASEQPKDSTTVNIEQPDPNKQSAASQQPQNIKEKKNIFSWLWSLLVGKDIEEAQFTFRNIMELKAVGIQVKSAESSCLNDIDLERSCFNLFGTLKLPGITVDDSTAPVLLNMVAYEMCPEFENKFEISAYISFMDSLIDHPEDVKELRNASILHNMLGSDKEVAKLFNEISTDMVPNLKIYAKVKKDLQTHFENRWATLMNEAYYNHFSSPWTFLASGAAAIGLILSFIQTFYPMK